MGNYKVDLTPNIKRVLKIIFEKSNNEWINAKDCSLNKIYFNNGFDNNWGAIINKYLKTSKFFGIEGEKRVIRFRSYNAEEPDYDTLAKEVIKFREDNDDTFHTKLSKKTISKKEQIEKETNLIRIPREPKYPKREFDEDSEFGEVRHPVKVEQIIIEKQIEKIQIEKETQNNTEENFHKEQKTYAKLNEEKLQVKEEKINLIKKVINHFNVDEVCYALYNNQITEFEVSLVKRKGVVYLHNLENKKHNLEICDVMVDKIFETPEILVNNLINNIIF